MANWVDEANELLQQEVEKWKGLPAERAARQATHRESPQQDQSARLYKPPFLAEWGQCQGFSGLESADCLQSLQASSLSMPRCSPHLLRSTAMNGKYCPPSALVRQNERVEEGRISGSS
jgi:hypothetical protein